jgi:uncharacterized protein (TIGR00255 family)
MIKSMTGFGAADGTVGGAPVSVEVRSVNHRFFTPSLKLPGAFSRWEGEVRDMVRRSVSRGHITVFARVERGSAPSVQVDETLFAAYARRLEELRSSHGIEPPVDVATILRMPEVISAEEREAGSSGELLGILGQALAAFNAMRAAEGARLGDDLRERLATIESDVEAIARRAPDRVVEQRDRLARAVSELAGGVAVDEQRLVQEIAFLADRIDVQEELTRFRSHLSAFRDTLDSPPADGVGKRLGFLLQELLREANTTGSKANDMQITRHVLAIKEELERIREQVENLE